MSQRGHLASVSLSENFDTHADTCRRCRAVIVTFQRLKQPRRRYVLCAECTAKAVRELKRQADSEVDHGESSAPTLH